MSELFREIEDDIRRERIDRLWHSFGRMMVGVSALVVLATAGIVLVQNHKQFVASERTSVIMKAIERTNIEDYKGAILLFDSLAADDTSPYYGLAMLHKAQAEGALGEKDEAKKTYETLARHDAVFGALAQMLAASPGAGGNVIAQPDSNSPLYYTQSEFRAWQLLQQGKKAEAADQFAMLAHNISGPPTIRERALEVLQHIAPEKLIKDEPMSDEKGNKKDKGDL